MLLKETTPVINIKLGSHRVHGSCSSHIDPEVGRSKAEVTHLSNALPVWVGICLLMGLLGFPGYMPTVLLHC